MSIFRNIDRQRETQGYLSIEATMALGSTGTVVLDPFSTLIAATADIGEDNLFYPGVVIRNEGSGHIRIRNRNVFHPNTYCLAADGGTIEIGEGNLFEGGVSLKANAVAARIVIGDRGRYLNGAQVLDGCTFGTGAQLIGSITAHNCRLEGGEDFRCPDPDRRAGLLKGFGTARNLTVARGQVIEGFGRFEQAAVASQAANHPRA